MTKTDNINRTRLLSPGVNVLIDGQWGSTGKGKLSAYLASKSDVVWNTADFAPNAGHTVVFEGKEYVTKTIPSGYVNREAKLFLTAASVINLDNLAREVDLLQDFQVAERLSIHPNAAVVTPEDLKEEQAGMKDIASTMTGGGAALRRKIARKAKLAKDFPELRRYIRDRGDEILTVARKGGVVLAESAQGFDLSLNHGHLYPFTTSRDVTTANVLANLGAPPQLMSRCWASMRAHPIRVGHLYDKTTGDKLGDSGPYYPDQVELSWDEITERAGSRVALQEMTTVTKRVRRIFSWSDMQFQRFLTICQPTDISLNFANYLDGRIAGAQGGMSQTYIRRNYPKIAEHLHGMIGTGYKALGVDSPVIGLLGTGPANDEMVEIDG